MGKKITWGRDVTKLGHKLFNNNYVGTFSSDKIPNLGTNPDGSRVFYKNKSNNNVKPNSKLYSIVNLDNSNMPGSHWIALAYNIPENKNDGQILVYDSFGRNTKDIIPAVIDKFKDTNISLVTADQDAEQDVLEEDCGARSLAFLFIMDRLGADKAVLI